MRILCVHQGFELYGSDRCFVDSVRAIRACFPSALIQILLPKDGPLKRLLEREPFADEVRVAPLWVIRKHGLGRILAKAPVSFPLAFARAVRAFKQSDLVYINTVAVLDFLAAAKLFRRKALLHVHEAPEGLIGAAFGAAVRHVGAPTIFNSEATRDAYRPKHDRPSYVLYNGVRAPEAPRACSYDGKRRLRLLVLGRLSHGKGQDILIDACKLLPRPILDALDIRIVGSSFGARTEFEGALLARARHVAGPETIRFEPFVADTAPLYTWCDLVVVPSRVREGFGRVAAEAMAYGRAGIVAAHGGLTEIVAHGETGWCVRPKDPGALAHALRAAAEAPDLVRAFGAAARRRFDGRFAEDLVATRLRHILRERMADSLSRGECRPMAPAERP